MADTITEPDQPESAVSADLVDERLIQGQGLSGYLSLLLGRVKGGELGSLPVVLGLVIICTVFYAIDPAFLSSYNLVSMTQFAAPVGMIALGIVLVLLLGEIDLSVGSVSGFAAACMAVLIVNKGWDPTLGLLAGILVGTAVGLVYAVLYTRLGVPSFVFTLAGLLAFQGGLLYVLGDTGTIRLPAQSWLVQFARFKFVPETVAYVLVVLIALAYLGSQLYGRSRRSAAGLSNGWLPIVFVKAGAMLVGLGYLTYYLSIDRGWGYLWLLFAALVVVMDLVLRKTTWGRHVFAVGGNEEAARRSGIRVGLIYTSVFVGCSTFAALGGLMVASNLTTVSQASGTTDTNLTAIAAAVIGGTSLFGGRGSAYAAMLGILVLQAIRSGLNIINVDSDVRFVVTGLVLLLAVAIDSVSRRVRTSSGRG
jgi:D-xylose transport system permease protein